MMNDSEDRNESIGTGEVAAAAIAPDATKVQSTSVAGVAIDLKLQVEIMKLSKDEEASPTKNKAKELGHHGTRMTGAAAKQGAPQMTDCGLVAAARSESTDDNLEAWRNEVNPLPSSSAAALSDALSVPGAWPIDSPFARSSSENPLSEPSADEELGAAGNSGNQIHLDATLSPGESPPGNIDEERSCVIPPRSNHPLVEAKLEPEEPGQTRQTVYVSAILIFVVVIVILVLGLVGAFDKDADSSVATNAPRNSSLANMTNISVVISPKRNVFEEVRDSGVLRCAFLELPGGLVHRDPQTRKVTGFNSVWCKAVAAAMSTPDRPIQVNYSDFNPFLQPTGGPHHINPVGITHTMQRHVRASGRGFSFSRPVLYGGTKVAGQPFHVDCIVNKNFRHVDECQGLSLCVMGKSSQQAIAEKHLPPRLIRMSETPAKVLTDFISGICTTFMLESSAVAEPMVRGLGYTGNYSVGDAIYSKTPIGLVTDKNDPRWADFVNAVAQSLLVAEQYNITQSTADLMPEFTGFGEDYKGMFQNAVREVGNYAEVYQTYLEPIPGRNRLNRINDGSTGLLYSPPLGTLSDQGQLDNETPLGHRLDSILERGVLRCGIDTGKGLLLEGQSVNVTGLNTEYCRGVSASLFGGDVNAVQVVTLENPQDGYQKLASGDIDVIAGATWTLANDVAEPTTGLGFAFSQPYLYGRNHSDNLCLAVMQDDHDWLTYVYWMVAATVYAEEESIQQSDHNEMPLIHLYGPGLERMFRDTILAIGNYGEIYSRHFPNIGRSGRNTLNNALPHPGPEHYPMPGFFE